MRRLYRTLGVILCAVQGIIAAGQAAPSAEPDPSLRMRPPEPPPGNRAAPKGSLHFDFSVTDAAGNPVTDLQPWDLKLTDNGRVAKIMFFRGYDGKIVLPDPPVEVIVVIDELNLSLQQVAFLRDQVVRFLRQNGGHPAQPVSIMLLTDKGLHVQPQPSLDGNGMAAMVEAIQPHVSSIIASMGLQGSMERAQRSVRELQRIADNEAGRPGRKVLLWMGPGWPLLDTIRIIFTPQQTRAFFDTSVILLNGLRKAQITVYSIVPQLGIDESILFRYQSFLKPVEDARQASPANLGLGVLAEQSGGGVVGPSNDLVAGMNACLTHASAYYRISFDQPAEGQRDAYHAIRLQFDRPGLKVRSHAGYYYEPGNAAF